MSKKDMSKKSLEDWMTEHTTEAKSKPSPYDEWPEKAMQEVELALIAIDKGSHVITMEDMVERLNDVYEMNISVSTLRRFVKRKIGRKSWNRA